MSETNEDIEKLISLSLNDDLRKKCNEYFSQKMLEYSMEILPSYFLKGQPDTRTAWQKFSSRVGWRWDCFREWLSKKIYDWSDYE